MSDENLEPQAGQEESNQEPVELSPVEQEAIASGWVPKDDYQGDEHKWVDAAEFLRRGELFKKIENQNRELKDVKRALQDLKKLHTDVREIEYKRALETLRAQKKAALEDNDADAVIAADERIDLVKEEQRRLHTEVDLPETQDTGEQHPEFVSWKSKNQWYVNSTPMKAYADQLGAEYARQGFSPSEVLRKVETDVRKEFPHKFQNPKQSRPGGVEGPTGRGVGGGGSGFQLTAEERTIMNRFVRQGVLTEKEYIDSLKVQKGVK